MKGNDYIKNQREQNGLSQRQLASSSGLSNATISRIEKGTVIPDINTIFSLAKALHIKRAHLLEVYGYIDTHSELTKHVNKIPVFGRIPAGLPLEAVEDIVDWEQAREQWTESEDEFFALRIKNDSMSPKYIEGDNVIFRKQDTCGSGQDAVVVSGSDDAALKRVVIKEDGTILQPINPLYPPEYYSKKDAAANPVKILGVAIELRRKIK